MGRRRGFFAELQHQKQMEQKRRQQQTNAAYKAHAAATRRSELAQKQAERAASQLSRATAAEQKNAEREAKQLHEGAMQAEVERRNTELANQYEEIDGILVWTLELDDFVDLESLRKVVAHPPFPRADLELPTPNLAPLVAPAEPMFLEPAAGPKGLGGVFGGRKKHAELVTKAQAEFSQSHQEWQAKVDALPAAQARQDSEYEKREHIRLEQLASTRSKYDDECRERELAVQSTNAELDTLIANLAYDAEEAIQEYVSIVLGNSVYPDSFPVEHEFEFNSILKELTLTVHVPEPSVVPNVKEYRYVRAKDEITSTALPLTELKGLYRNAVAQVALRTLQEVFEADRASKIRTISLIVSTEAIDPATGHTKITPLIAVAADRETFMGFELENVVPIETLHHLGALVSKNPFDLVPIDTSKGVRGT